MASECKGVEVGRRASVGAKPRRLVAACIGNAYPSPDAARALPKCVGDADAMTRCLVDDLHAAENDVQTLHNADSEQMLASVYKMLHALASGSTGVLYFSGHAQECTNGDLLMLGCDDDGTSHGGTMSLLHVLLLAQRRIVADKLSAVTVVVLLDCCRDPGAEICTSACSGV